RKGKSYEAAAKELDDWLAVSLIRKWLQLFIESLRKTGKNCTDNHCCRKMKSSICVGWSRRGTLSLKLLSDRSDLFIRGRWDNVATPRLQINSNFSRLNLNTPVLSG